MKHKPGARELALGLAVAAVIGVVALPRTPSFWVDTEPPPQEEPPRPKVDRLARLRVDEALAAWRSSQESTRDHDLVIRLRSQGRRAVPYLGWHLEHQTPDLPVAAIALGLGQIGDPAGLTPLERLLRSPEEHHRAAAVVGLGNLRVSNALPPLLVAVGDSSRSVARPAAKAFLDLAASIQPRRLVDTIVAALRASERPRAYALLLGSLGSRDAHGALTDLLEDREDRFRIASLVGLSSMADLADAALVHSLLDDDSPAVVKQACLFLGEHDYFPAAEDLIGLLMSEDRGVAANAHWALGKISGVRLIRDPELWDAWWERSGRRHLEEWQQKHDG